MRHGRLHEVEKGGNMKRGSTFQGGEISCTDAAERIGVSRRTVQRWLLDKRDAIAFSLSPGGHARIHEAQFRAWCDRHGITYRGR